MRRFDVVLIGDAHLAACIDAARLLGNPYEKNAAHITVGGPFKTPPRGPLKRDKIAGSKIGVFGLGRFRGERQNTVFLSCDSPLLRRLWRKPEHGYNPHITLYDGPSRSYAEHLYQRCADLVFEFSFPAGDLVRLESKKGQTDLDLPARFDFELVHEITHERVRNDDLSDMEEPRRLKLVHVILRYVAKTYSRRIAVAEHMKSLAHGRDVLAGES